MTLRPNFRQLSCGLFLAVFLSLPGTEASASDFSFVVIGDTRPPYGSSNYDNFKKQIGRIESFHPGFMINVGDLIYGYGGSENEGVWADYQKIVSCIHIPYHQIPGNHDIFSKKAEKIYNEIFHQPYYSFNSGGCHFILLDNAESGIWGYISDKQLAWLKKDLAGDKSKMTFVFMHVPLWIKDNVDQKYYQFWKSTLHPLFLSHHIKAVFAGHIHSYGPTQKIDGIEYFVTGGGGAELVKWYQSHGGEYHFMLIRVHGNKFDHKIVTDTKILSEKQADVKKNIDFAQKHAGVMVVDMKKAMETHKEPFEIAIHNPSQKTLTGTAQWNYDPDYFQLDPHQTSIHIDPGQTVAYPFTVAILNQKFFQRPFPSLSFLLQYGSEKVIFIKDLVFHRRLLIPRAGSPIAVDGSLDNWPQAAPIILYDKKDAHAVAEIMTAYDEKNLYIAATVHDQYFIGDYDDSMIFMNDAFIITLDRNLKRMAHGNDDLQLEISKTNHGVVIYNRSKGEKIRLEAEGIAAVVSKAENGDVVYEIALPGSFLKPMELKSKTQFGISFGVCNAGVQGKTDLISWTPGIEIEGLDDSFHSQLNFAGADLE
jgi:hypothetical protein